MMKKKMCVYCEEFPASTKIMSPNYIVEQDWDICVTCSKLIPLQEEMSVLLFIAQNMDDGIGREQINKKIIIIKNIIEDLVRESGLEIYLNILRIK